MTNFAADVDKFFKQIKVTLEKATNEKTLRILGNEAVRLIKLRTRLGYGVSQVGGKRQRLTKLKESYKKVRKDNRGELSSETRPGKSNLTFSGQLLDSMKVIKIRNRQVIVGPQGRRKSILGQKRILNQDLARFVTEKGRPFMPLSDLEIKKLDRFYRNRFGDLVNKDL